MVKNILFLGSLIFCLAYVVSADFAPPTNLPPHGNTPPPLHTGNVTQIRHGALGIQISPAALNIPEGVALYTDATIGIEHNRFVATNPEWQLNSATFALDTNAPISVNGVFSTGPIRSEASIIAPSVAIDSLKSTNTSSLDRQVCAQATDGLLISCAEVAGSQLQVALSVVPQSILPNVPTVLDVSWQASPVANSCIALEGDGFSTDGLALGSDKTSAVVLDSGETAQYVVACSDAYGNTKIAALEVVAKEHAPRVGLSINPPTGGWSNGDFFTTGVALDSNGGGVMNCRKKVEGNAVSPNNKWSGQASGVWSVGTSIPPASSQTINTCYNGCQFRDVVTEPNSSAVLTLQCSNSSATTTDSKWINIGQ